MDNYTEHTPDYPNLYQVKRDGVTRVQHAARGLAILESLKLKQFYSDSDVTVEKKGHVCFTADYREKLPKSARGL